MKVLRKKERKKAEGKRSRIGEKDKKNTGREIDEEKRKIGPKTMKTFKRNTVCIRDLDKLNSDLMVRF